MSSKWIKGRSSATGVLSANVVVRRNAGSALTSFKSAGGKTVRVLDSGVYRKASAQAGRVLSEIQRSPKKPK
jgi:hypothetical protein